MVSRVDGKSSRPKKFKQTTEGHQQAIKCLQWLAQSGVLLEATGVYYLGLAVALAHAGLDFTLLAIPVSSLGALPSGFATLGPLLSNAQ